MVRACASVRRDGQAVRLAALRVGVDAAAARAVLRLHLGAVTHAALAVGLTGLLDGQVHGGAGSRLKSLGEQAAATPRGDMPPSAAIFLHLLPLCVNKTSNQGVASCVAKECNVKVGV